MRFFIDLALISFLLPIFALPGLGRPASGSSSTRTIRSSRNSVADTHSPFKRLLSGYICATADLTLNANVYTCVTGLGGTTTCTVTATVPVNLGAGLCICLSNGRLTAAAEASIAAAVNSAVNQVTVSALTAVNGNLQQFADAAAIIAFLENQVLNEVGGETTQCNDYPTGSIPDSCTSCHYTCPTNTYLCGDACIDDTLGCSSGQPVQPGRKRDFLLGPDVKCPAHLSACGIPSTAFFTGKNFECVDTTSDIESCGACAFPLPGQPMGSDCTAIPHTLGVTCSFGRCIVESCERGFELNSEASACVVAARQSIFDPWRKGKAIIKARQVNAAELRAKGAF